MSSVSSYDEGDVEAYSSTIRLAVKRYYALPSNIPNKIKSEFIIKVNNKGKIYDVRLIKSSGFTTFDNSARNAIKSSSPLPLPSNPALRDRVIQGGIRFKFEP